VLVVISHCNSQQHLQQIWCRDWGWGRDGQAVVLYFFFVSSSSLLADANVAVYRSVLVIVSITIKSSATKTPWGKGSDAHSMILQYVKQRYRVDLIHHRSIALVMTALMLHKTCRLALTLYMQNIGIK
jgi:hypothetical protein